MASIIKKYIKKNLPKSQKSALEGGSWDTSYEVSISETGNYGTSNTAAAMSTQEWLRQYNENPRLSGLNKVVMDNGVANFGLYSDKDGVTRRVVGHPLEKSFKDHTVPMIFGLWTALRYMTGVVYICYDIEDGIPSEFKLFTTQHVQSSTQMNMTFKVGSSTVTYPKTQIIVDLDINIADPYAKGFGRATSILESIEMDTMITRYLKAFYTNSAQPSMIVVPKPSAEVELPDEEDLKRLAADFSRYHKGIGNSHKTAFLSFPATIEAIPNNHQEMELLETRKALRDEALQHIGIPPEIVGIVENSNKATVIAAEHIYAKQVRQPTLHHFEDIINSRILPLYGDDGLGTYFKFDDILPDDREEMRKDAKEGREAGTITIDEHRAMLQLPPLADGKGKYLIGETPEGEAGPVEASNQNIYLEEIDYSPIGEKTKYKSFYGSGEIRPSTYIELDLGTEEDKDA